MGFTRYLSYDIRDGNDYDDLYKFIKKHRGEEITKSLYRFVSDLKYDDFARELRKTIEDYDSVYLIVNDNGPVHRRVVP